MRTIFYKEQPKQSIIEPIVIHPSIFDLCISQPNGGGFLYVLYSFYYKTARWQKTNQPKCTNSFVTNFLKCDRKTVIKYKKILIELGLIRPIKKIGKNGQIVGHFIHVNYVWNKDTVRGFNHRPIQHPDDVSSNKITIGPSDPPVDGVGLKCLKSGKGNALSFKNNIEKKEKTLHGKRQKREELEISKDKKYLKYIPLAKKLSKIIKSQKNINHTLPQLKSWANEMLRLERDNKIPIERMEDAMDWYEMAVGGEYIPVIESGKSFREKFIKIENAIERSKTIYKKPQQSKNLSQSRTFRGKADIVWKKAVKLLNWKERLYLEELGLTEKEIHNIQNNQLKMEDFKDMTVHQLKKLKIMPDVVI